MLYKKQNISDSTLLGIWKIEESKEELLSILDINSCIDDTLSIKSQSRVLEKLAVQFLIKELCGEQKEFAYYPSGQPYLTDHSHHIGISHTRGYVAVILDKESKVSIDIEQITDKVKRVQSRLISENEYIDSSQELVHLLLHWSAKETMYKILGRVDVDFLKDLYIKPFTPLLEDALKGRDEKTDRDFQIHYQVTTDFVLTYLISRV